ADGGGGYSSALSVTARTFGMRKFFDYRVIPGVVSNLTHALDRSDTRSPAAGTVEGGQGPLPVGLEHARQREGGDALRPVVLEQARQRAVGERPAAGLARGAVVRLVARVDDALDGRAAAR